MENNCRLQFNKSLGFITFDAIIDNKWKEFSIDVSNLDEDRIKEIQNFKEFINKK